VFSALYVWWSVILNLLNFKACSFYGLIINRNMLRICKILQPVMAVCETQSFYDGYDLKYG